jgi:hypothetical protein
LNKLIATIVSTINSWLGEEWGVQKIHVFSEENKVLVKLAKICHSLHVLDNPPKGLWSFIVVTNLVFLCSVLIIDYVCLVLNFPSYEKEK